jgi:hypothetical protein
LLQRRFEVFDDFLSENVGRRDFLSAQSFQRLERLELLNDLNGGFLAAPCVGSFEAFVSD